MTDIYIPSAMDSHPLCASEGQFRPQRSTILFLKHALAASNRCCYDLQIDGWVTIRSVKYYRIQRRREIQDSHHRRPGRAVEFSLLSFKNCLCTSIAVRIRLESGLKSREFRIVTRSLSYTQITSFRKTPSNKSCHQQARFLPTQSRHFSSPLHHPL